MSQQEGNSKMRMKHILMLLGSLYPSLRNFSKTRSSIALALMIFILVFLFQNIGAIDFHFTMTYTLPVELEMGGSNCSADD
jgi:low affinity Fe/Cu permease